VRLVEPSQPNVGESEPEFDLDEFIVDVEKENTTTGNPSKLGFIQSVFDQCLPMVQKKNLFMIIFVDDCGICAKHAKLIDQLIEELETEGFKLTR
jgi:hypothetical protein